MTEGPDVLDASALLAFLQEEPGADLVEERLDGAIMSAVNLSEVIQKAEQHGAHTEGLEYDLEALGLGFVEFDVPAARIAAELRSAGAGLSLGDRACLALAKARAGTAITANRRWEGLGSAVRVIR